MITKIHISLYQTIITHQYLKSWAHLHKGSQEDAQEPFFSLHRTCSSLKLSTLRKSVQNELLQYKAGQKSYHDCHTKPATVTTTALRRSQHTILTLSMTIAHTIDIFLLMQTKGDVIYNINNQSCMIMYAARSNNIQHYPQCLHRLWFSGHSQGTKTFYQ